MERTGPICNGSKVYQKDHPELVGEATHMLVNTKTDEVFIRVAWQDGVTSDEPAEELRLK